MTNTSLTVTERLTKTLERTSLDDLVQARTRRSVLLVDCSGSMRDPIYATNERKIDALRTRVDLVRAGTPVPIAAFGPPTPYRTCVQLVDRVPEPGGMTPMDEAIHFAKEQGATHIVLITDGVADSPDATLDAAKKFGGPIDVFYVGNGDDHGAKFARELARLTGGKSDTTDLTGAPKELAGKITLLIGDGSL